MKALHCNTISLTTNKLFLRYNIVGKVVPLYFSVMRTSGLITSMFKFEAC